MSTDEQPSLAGSDSKIDPSLFPVPKTQTYVLEMRAATLRSGGAKMRESGDDIVQTWGGLSECYQAPEAETLYVALDEVSTNGSDVESATNRVANALETFAETVRGIKAEWRSLKAEANTFLAEIADDEDWNKPNHWFTTSSEHGDENARLIGEATRLIGAFEEAERDCAEKINAGIAGRTNFLSGEESQGRALGANDFVYDTVNLNTDIPSSWGEPPGTDKFWYQDVGDAVWDFGVGAVEGVGAMVGAHSSEGWLAQSWGDSLKEYHWDNLTSAASLVGMYDAESDSLGWSGLDSAGEAWKDLAHSVVPWEEWGDRPGYVIGTALLNIGATVGGAALTATGVGAVVGVPLMAWRGAAILDGMGGSGRGGSDGGSGMELPDLPDMPTYGGSGAPVVNVDASNFTPAQAAQVTASLDRLNAATSSGGGGGSSNNESSPGGRPSQPRLSTDPTGGDLAKAERATSPEASNREADSGDGSKKSDAKKPPNWTSGSKDSVEPNHKKNDPEKEPAYAGGRGDNDTLTESKKTPTAAPTQANANKIDAPGTGTRSGNEVPDQQTGDRGADLKDDKSTAQNQSEKGPVSPKDDPGGNNDSTAPEVPPAGGNGNGSNGNPPAGGPPDPPRSPGSEGPSDPNLEKKLANAEALEKALEKAGMSERDIADFRGGYSRESREWQRVADAVGQNYGKNAIKEMLPKTIKFAREGASNLFEVAYRYEYYKATFDGLVRDAEISGIKKSDAQKQIGAEMGFDPVQRTLDSDVGVVRDQRPSQGVRADHGLSDGDLTKVLQSLAGDIGMGDDISAAYHARKHYGEILSSEKTGNHVVDYLQSLETTIREGEIASRSPLDGGGERLIVRRPVLDEGGNVKANTDKKGITRESYLRAVVIIGADGKLVVPTYGLAAMVVGR